MAFGEGFKLRGELSLFIFATEDRKKVLSKISEVFEIPSKKIEKQLMISNLKGHFGYSIQYLRLPLDETEAYKIIKVILTEMSDADKCLLLDEIEDYVDSKGNLYIRLDKQRLCLGRVNLSEKDPVRIVIKNKREKIIKLIKQAVKVD